MSCGIASPLRIQPDIVPNIVKDAKIYAVPLQATAREAAQRMATFGTGALVVLDAGGRFVGLVTEQDVVREVVAKGMDAGAVRLAELVKQGFDALAPSDLVLDALDLMRIRKISHLPVLDGERLTAIVSVGDISEAVRQTLDAQLRARQATFFGSQLRE
jgi:signal-transduction protein with cAMP-binding, CBS, and nucleotidyltransferase domain